MALIECWECGAQVSDHAAACPHCGAPSQQQRIAPRRRFNGWHWAGVSLIVLGAGWMGLGYASFQGWGDLGDPDPWQLFVGALVFALGIGTWREGDRERTSARSRRVIPSRDAYCGVCDEWVPDPEQHQGDHKLDWYPKGKWYCNDCDEWTKDPQGHIRARLRLEGHSFEHWDD